MKKLYSFFIVLFVSVFVVGCPVQEIQPTEPAQTEIESNQRTHEQIKKSVVKIRSKKREGTGFVVGVADNRAYIITVVHVVEGDPEPTVEFFGNKELKAQVLNSEEQGNGLALLLVNGQIPYDAMPLYLAKKTQSQIRRCCIYLWFSKGRCTLGV
ncbi:secreted protein [Beggiatoa sp. PS]|nr:secreted protein [Beggiatoa sp. PS]